jgi:hypothetical protein
VCLLPLAVVTRRDPKDSNNDQVQRRLDLMAPDSFLFVMVRVMAAGELIALGEFLRRLLSMLSAAYVLVLSNP